MIAAIQTHYAGCHFRSRLEARWAVFFDALGIKWEYEKEGFTNAGRWTGIADYYLPDFYLPTTKTWVEVKGDPEALKRDNDKMWRLHDYGGVLPDFSINHNENAFGLILLGSIPYPDNEYTTVIEHPIIRHDRGLVRSWCGFYPSDLFHDGCGSVLIKDTYEGFDDNNPTIWDIEPRVHYCKSPSYYIHSINNAYLAARAKRFEFE